jgi:hypothetical protein
MYKSKTIDQKWLLMLNKSTTAVYFVNISGHHSIKYLSLSFLLNLTIIDGKNKIMKNRMT